MASLKISVALAILAIAFPSSSFATNWVVGDSSGWALNYDYVAWANGKDFVVGDTLEFKYKAGDHNVVKVNGTEFDACTEAAGDETLTSGDDIITLAKPGQKWYICGLTGHCAEGMKLAITVTSEGSPSPSPAAVPPTSGGTEPPPSAATGIAFSKCHAWVAGIFSILMMIIA